MQIAFSRIMKYQFRFKFIKESFNGKPVFVLFDIYI